MDNQKHLIEGTVEHEEYMTLAYKYGWIEQPKTVRDYFSKLYGKIKPKPIIVEKDCMMVRFVGAEDSMGFKKDRIYSAEIGSADGLVKIISDTAIWNIALTSFLNNFEMIKNETELDKLKDVEKRIAVTDEFVSVEDLNIRVMINVDGKLEGLTGRMFTMENQMEMVKSLGIELDESYPLVAIKKDVIKDKIFYTYSVEVNGEVGYYKGYWFKEV